MISHPLFEQVFEFKVCESTTTEAQNRLYTLTGNALLIADEQTSGYGRKGNSWHSPKGGLWFTIAMKDLCVSANFTLFIGICLHNALQKITSSQYFKIKWPNDIYYQEKKVAGIIVKKVRNYHLIGIGVNTNCSLPPFLLEKATSLHYLHKINNQDLLFCFLNIFQSKFFDYLEQGLDQEYLGEFSFLKGRKVTIGTQFANYTGKVKSISKDGSLVMLLDNGMTQPFFSGSILDFSTKEKR